MGKYISHDTVACHLWVPFPVVGNVAPRSPRLNCPTVHRPGGESHVLVSSLREGTVWPGQVSIPRWVGQGEGGGLVSPTDVHRTGLP